MNVKTAAGTFEEARDRYHECFREHFAQRVQPLPDDRFWQLHPVFLHEVHVFRFVYNRTNGVAQAAGEFFRKPVVDHFYDGSGQMISHYSFDEALQFAKTWGQIVDRLHPALFGVVTDRSDDTYGDLIDSLPLLGRELVDQAVEGKFTKMQQLVRAIGTQCRVLDFPAVFVLQGENYFAANLYEAARDYFAHRATDESS